MVTAMSLRSRVGQVKERTLDRALRPRGRRSFRQEFERAAAAGPVRINFGSGGEPLPGWINTDVAWHAGCYLDATVPWPVPDGSVAHVYADNVIEHLTLEQGRSMLRNCFRALEPGGVVRLATPDVEAVARQYIERGELCQAGLERNRERGRDLRYPVQLLTQVYVGAKHYLGFLYDEEALGTEMRDAGFEVERAPTGSSRHAVLDGLEARSHPAEAATQLVLEGTKPAR